MTSMAGLLLVILGVPIVVSVVYWRRTVPLEICDPKTSPQSQRQDSAQTDNLVGQTLYTIIARVGPAINYSAVGKNLLVQWVGPGRHLSLLFEYRGPKPSQGVVYISEHENDLFCVRVKYQYFGRRWSFPPRNAVSEPLPDRVAA